MNRTSKVKTGRKRKRERIELEISRGLESRWAKCASPLPYLRKSGILVGMSLSERAAKAAKIAEEPHLYKVCEGCDSIVTERVATCPSCHGYRFDGDPGAVIEQARILGSREQRSVVTEDLL
jgi:hypothetical protein